MNKDFFFNLAAGFLFVVLVCGSVVLADYVFFEGELLKKTEASNASLKVQLRNATKSNEQMKLQIMGANVEMEAMMQKMMLLEQKAAQAGMTNVLKKDLELMLAENKVLKNALKTPEHAFMAHLDEAIHNEYPDIHVVDGKFIFKDDVFFPSASATLTDKSRKALDRVAQIITELGGKISPEANWVIKVMGHADQQRLKYKKPFSSNWILASSRAVNIVRHLISKGVDANRIYAAGFAAHRARDAKTDAKSLNRTRRAVLSFDRRVGDA